MSNTLSSALRVDDDLAVAQIDARLDVEAQLAAGVALKHITRHVLGLFHGQPGGRAFRQVLSEGAHRDGAGWTLVEQALEGENTALPTFVEARNQFELNYLRKLLQITKGNVTHAARMAGRNRTEFYKLLSRHELDANDFKE